MLPNKKEFCINHLSAQNNLITASSHFHEYYEVFYFVAGQQTYFINHDLFNAKQGDVILINKKDIHQHLTPQNNDSCEKYRITFSDTFVSSLKNGFDLNILMSCFSSKKINAVEKIRYELDILINKIWTNSQADNEISYYTAKLGIIELLLTLSGMYERQLTKNTNSSDNNENRIQEACQYICKYYSNAISLESIAKIVYMSPTYFSKKFKKVTGMGFVEFLNNIRIKNATDMLSDTQLSINDIAILCGYQDTNYFSDVFRKIVGTSPNSYRKKSWP